MTYDAANELVGVTYSDGVTPNVSNLTYDADGQRTGMSDGTGSSTWVWDSLHRLTSFTDGHRDQVQYQYNLRGLITQIMYPGSLPVTRGYDNAGRWNSVQDWLGNTTNFGYDANSNLTTKTLPAGTSIVDTTGYNAADQNTSITDVKNSTTLFGATYGRDNAGQVASDSSLPSGVGSDRYTNLNQLCYAGSSTTNACATPPAGSQAYGFDAADNLTNANGATQAFNAADELCWTVSGSSSNACGSAPAGATTYSYDPRGNRTTVTPSSGSATHLGYDQANRLSSYGQGSTTTATYAYNGDGLRMSKTVSGVTSQFTWDVVSSPTLLLSDGTTDYVYGPGNLLLEQITPQPAISLVGTATASGKSSSLTLTLPTGVQVNDQVFVATTEPSSTTVTAPSGYTAVASVSSTGGSAPSTTIVYRHTVASGDTSVTLSYSRKTAQAAVLAVYRGIDSSTPVDVFQTGSASSGTTVTAPSVTTTYGNERLAVFQGAAGSFSGKSWTAPSGTTEQVQSNATANASMGIADQTVGAAGATGTRVSTFGSSANLTTVMLAAPTPPVVLFAHADQLGSTRLLTDTAGVLRATYTYDPYGNVTASSGTSSTAFAFAGQYKDAETGLYYFRARYYDPATGQFLSRDPAVATTRSPYGYVGGNPLNATDQNGLGINLPGGFCLRNPFSTDDSCQSLASGFENSAAGAYVNGLANGLTGGVSGRIAGSLGSGYSTCDPNYPAYVNGERGGFGTPESLALVYPNFQDPTKAPGPGWEWRGNGPVGSSRGAWYNPTTDQSLHPDLSHGGRIGPHYDYSGPDTGSAKVRLYPGDPVPELPPPLFTPIDG